MSDRLWCIASYDNNEDMSNTLNYIITEHETETDARIEAWKQLELKRSVECYVSGDFVWAIEKED